MESLSSLGDFQLMEGKKQRHQESLPGVDVVKPTTYFEKVVIPDVFGEMGFVTDPIGGKDEPDMIVYHNRINPETKIDVESTIVSNYDMTKWDQDTGKFNRYRKKRKLSKLLIVCQSDSISTAVVRELNSTNDPVTMIEFADLRAVRTEFGKTFDDVKVFNTLTKDGKINLGNALTLQQAFPPRVYFVHRNL